LGVNNFLTFPKTKKTRKNVILKNKLENLKNKLENLKNKLEKCNFEK